MKASRCALPWLAVALASAWFALALSSPAVAHEELLSSDPADATLIETLPSRARLAFSGDVKEVHEVTVTGPAGSVVNGAPSISGTEVRQNLWAGPVGAYLLTYDVVSSDGHEIRGEVQFEVGPLSADVSGETADTAAPSDDAGGRSGIVVAASVLLAGAAIHLLLRRRMSRQEARSLRR